MRVQCFWSGESHEYFVNSISPPRLALGYLSILFVDNVRGKKFNLRYAQKAPSYIHVCQKYTYEASSPRFEAHIRYGEAKSAKCAGGRLNL